MSPAIPLTRVYKNIANANELSTPSSLGTAFNLQSIDVFVLAILCRFNAGTKWDFETSFVLAMFL